MLRKLTLVFFILLAGGAAAHGNLKLINGRWYDGSGFVPKTMYSVEGVLRTSFDGQARVVDLGGRFVIPPFGDAHNHAFGDDTNLERELARFLRAGVFYVKNPNNSASLANAVRPHVNKPESVDVIYANGGLTKAGGHPSQIYAPLGERFADAYVTVDSEAELAAKWAGILAGRPDFLKIYLQHSEDAATNRGLKLALLPAILERAHRDGLTVTAHVTSAADFHAAVAAGVDEIAHLPLGTITEADATLAARKKITVVTTLLSHRPDEGFKDQRANLTLLERAGVNVVLGVDSGHLVVEEAHAVGQLGVYTMPELLHLLVETTPRTIFPKRKIGRLDDGYEASLLALDGNPLEDPSAMGRIVTRIKQGHLLEVPPDTVTEEQRRNAEGYALLNHVRFDDAIALFRENTAKFPQSSNAWDSLGEAYMGAGKRDLAIESYRKALELNPKNTNAEAMLKKLRGE
ncbi:MAG: tetratricopeptide repeat protein [Acidobacteriota bacterium]